MPRKDRLEGLSSLDNGAHAGLYSELIEWDCCYFDHETGILFQAIPGEGYSFVRKDVEGFLDPT